MSHRPNETVLCVICVIGESEGGCLCFPVVIDTVVVIAAAVVTVIFIAIAFRSDVVNFILLLLL